MSRVKESWEVVESRGREEGRERVIKIYKIERILFATSGSLGASAYRTNEPCCSFRTISAPNKTARCLEVDLNESFMCSASSPTVAAFFSFRYLRISSRR